MVADRLKLNWTNGAEVIFLLICVLLVLIPWSPRIQPAPSVDSGVFLYAGWQVTEGKLPYRDFWDHKPPLIFYVNALGLLISNGSRWGVWALEVIALLAAALIGYDVMKRAFGIWSAVYISFAWLLNAFLTGDGGNYTTEYALPFQFGILWLIATAHEANISIRRAFLIGVFSGILFWLKQSVIGIPLAVGLYWLVLILTTAEKRNHLRALVAMSAGVIALSLIILAPFIIQGALADLWDTTIWFNLVYTDETWFSRLLSLRLMGSLMGGGFALLAFMGWLAASITWIGAWRGGSNVRTRWTQALATLTSNSASPFGHTLNDPQRARLLLIALIAFPIELSLIAFPGNPFDHYFLAILPTGAILAAFAFRMLMAGLERVWNSRYAAPIFIGIILIVAAFFAFQEVNVMLGRVLTRPVSPMIAYLEQNTKPDAQVMIWGSDARILFAARRPSATRYVYQHPLNRIGYTNVAKVQSFLDELSRNPPDLVLKNKAWNTPLMHFGVQNRDIKRRARQFLAMYHVREIVGGWTIYERRSTAP